MFDVVQERTRPRALILTSVFVSPDTQEYVTGGSVRVVRDLARLLREWGWDVCVAQKANRDGTATLPDGVPVLFVRAATRSFTDPLFAFKTRHIARDADLTVFGTPELAFPCYASRAVVFQHGIWWDRPDSRNLRGVLVRWIQWIRNAAVVRRAKAILCVDTNFANYLRERGAPSSEISKCRYIPNYAHVQGPEPSLRDLIERFRARRLLFLRRFEAPRGPELFISICEHLRSRGVRFSARMVGGGSLTSKIRLSLSRAGLNQIVSVEERGLDQTSAVIEEATVSVIPSIWSEGTSLTAAESIVRGVPVVATDVGGLSNVVIPHFSGFLANADAVNLAQCIEKLLEDEELYLRIARQCLSLRRSLSFDRWRDGIQEVFEQGGFLPVLERVGTRLPLSVAEEVKA